MDRVGPASAPPAQPEVSAKDKAVAQNFAAVFLTEMVDEMMRTVKVGGLDGGHGEEVWRSFLARSVADQIAKTGTAGVAQSVERMLAAYRTQTGGAGDGES